MIVVAREASHRDASIGHVQWRWSYPPNRSRQSYLDEIVMLLGGMAAEEVILGDVFDGSGGVAGSDLQRASDIATIMLASLGPESLQYCDISSSRELDELRRDDPVLRRRVERLLEAELLRATTSIQTRRPKRLHERSQIAAQSRDVRLWISFPKQRAIGRVDVRSPGVLPGRIGCI